MWVSTARAIRAHEDGSVTLGTAAQTGQLKDEGPPLGRPLYFWGARCSFAEQIRVGAGWMRNAFQLRCNRNAPSTSRIRRRRPLRLLQPVNSRQWQDALKDRPQTDQNDEQFEKLLQATVIRELVDGPKTNGTDDDDDQNGNQDRKHDIPHDGAVTTP